MKINIQTLNQSRQSIIIGRQSDNETASECHNEKRVTAISRDRERLIDSNGDEESRRALARESLRDNSRAICFSVFSLSIFLAPSRGDCQHN